MARVALAGTFDRDFNRNRRLQVLLEQRGHEVSMCQVDLWGNPRYDILGERKLQVLGRALIAYPRLLWRFLRLRRPDLVVVGYPGWFDMLVLAPLARLRRVPVLFDPFISLYDTAVADRKIADQRSIMGRICRIVDRFSVRWATRVIADTPEHAAFYADIAGVPSSRIGVVWLGAQDDLFAPLPEVEPVPDRVLFHGTFIDLQGIGTIIRAAKLLEPDGINVRIVGSGQEQPLVDRLMAELAPTNVTLVGRVPVEQVAHEIASASLCLGIFGTSDKAGRVVPNKVFECTAVGRPVLTADTPAMRGAFTDTEVALVAPGDPEALAAEIRRLLADPETRAKLATSAHERYVQSYSLEPLSHLLDEEVARTLQAFGS